SAGGGGGIASEDGALTVVDSTLSTNDCNQGTGFGGCAVLIQSFGAADATFVLARSTVTDNRNQFGYGVAVQVESWGAGDAVATIENSTISANHGGTFAGSSTGGVYVSDSSDGAGGAHVTVNSTTIVGNDNVGLNALSSVSPPVDALVTLTNTIVAGNETYDCDGNVHSGGYNLVENPDSPYLVE